MARRFMAIGCVLSLALGACWTSASAGDELRQEGEERDRRLERLEAYVEATGAQLDAKVAQLEEVLQRATALLARNSADHGAKVEELQQQFAALQGELAELRHNHETMARSLATRGSDLEQRVEQLARRSEEIVVPTDKATHLAAARAAFTAREYAKARTLLKEYVTRYAQDSDAAGAQFQLGEAYRLDGQHARALGEFRTVIASYGSSDAVNDALMSMAISFYELHACSDAKSALEALSRRRPSTTLARQIKQKQDAIKKAPSGYCTS